MNSKSFLSFIFIVIAASYVRATEPVRLEFDGLKNLLESKSEKLKAARLSTEAAEERTGYLKRSFLPSVKLHASQESFKVGQGAQINEPAYGTEMSLNIFKGGQDYIEDSILILDKNIKNIEYVRLFAEELEQLRINFWNLLYTQEHIKLLEETLKVGQQNLKAANQRIRAGVSTETDRVEFEMHEVDLKRELDEYTLKLKILEKQISMALNLEAGEKLSYPAHFEHQHEYESYIAHSSKDHEFLFKEYEIQAESSQLKSKKQKNSAWPELDIYAGYNQFNRRGIDQSFEEDRTESVVGVKLSLNFMASVQAGSEAAALRKEAAFYKKSAEIKKKEVEAHIHAELSELEFLHKQVHSAEENIERAKKYYRLTQSEYSRGVKNSPDVLSATEKLFSVQKNYFEIVRDFQIAKAHVLAGIGK